MKQTFLKHLVCPTCNVPFDLKVAKITAGEIETGVLHCHGAGCLFPISRYVPRFVNEDEYADSFSKQRLYVRRHFKHYRKDRSGDALFISTTAFTFPDIKSGLTLEVGCGYGRFVDVVQRLGGEIVGIDLSTHSIDLAQEFVGLRENVHLVQCNLFQLPFPQGHFDRIYSIGVIHHTPAPREAFVALVPFLRRSGQISIWVYPPEMKSSSNRWRIFTTRIPHELLYYWCILNQILFSWIRRLPGGWRFNVIIPGCIPGPGRHFWLRVMSDFDDLSPMFASVHTSAEVSEWFLSAGLQSLRTLSRPTSMTGWKL